MNGLLVFPKTANKEADMATRKKKDSITLEMPGTIGSAKIILPETKVIKGKKKRLKVESDWRDYWSSSDELKADIEKLGINNFSREILHICPNKGLCNYLEAKEQMVRCVLETDQYYNSQVQCRVHRTHIKMIGK